MTAQLLAQALAMGQNPHASPEELRDAVQELVRLGAFDAALSAAERLHATGKFSKTVLSAKRFVRRLRDRGPDFEERFLARAITVAEDENARDDQLLRAAESLVVWGSLDQADRVLERLRAKGHRGRVNSLAAASRQLRRSGILNELESLTREKSLNRPYEVMIRRRKGAARTIVVLTGAARRFWLSLNVFHYFLRSLDAHVIYLSDHSGSLYLNGLASIGPGYDSMLRMLTEQIAELGAPSLHILAISGGGFVGLRTAIDLRATSFAGMSIMTTLAPSDSMPKSPLAMQLASRCRYPEMLVNLRPQVEASDYPKKAFLHCGALNEFDRAQMENLSGIPRVKLRYLENYKFHNVVGGLIANGEFGRVLRSFVGDEPAATSAVAGG